MAFVINCANDIKLLNNIKAWRYGINWPVVYIYYNAKKAYVGETLDALRRTEQHQKEEQFDEFTDVCFITNKTFNKSVILDLEAFLIKYMSAEGTKKLINGNAGVTDHNYFYKEAYEDDFREIWSALINEGIVSKALSDIENSELFKFSPYKSLNEEQHEAAQEIIKHICEANNASAQSLIQVIGGAGTGKTILAVYIIKLLSDINRKKAVWRTIDDEEEADLIRKLADKISGVDRIGFVVPMVELRKTMMKVFASIDGLSPDMIFAPEDVTDQQRFDLLVVDEAHRLYQNKHLPQGARDKFKKVNIRLMGEDYKNDSSDLTELDWIIRSSRLQVLFYDPRQSIRVPDIDRDRFSAICRPHLFKYIELLSQMRCKGGNGYYDYVKKILESSSLSAKDYQIISGYDARVFDSFSDMVQFIEDKNGQDGLCKLVAGPAWNLNDDIMIDGSVYHWVGSEKKGSNIIYSIHKTQGFDLNYAGVIFGPEIYYNAETKRIEVDKKKLKDNHMKSNSDENGDEKMREFVINIYLTLMTRGINGTVVYAMDDGLREYLKSYF